MIERKRLWDFVLNWRSSIRGAEVSLQSRRGYHRKYCADEILVHTESVKTELAR